jgi:hypothetical protein
MKSDPWLTKFKLGHYPEMSVSTDAIDWPTPIHRCSRAHCLARGGACNRPWAKHDAGPYNAAGRIADVLAVHDSAGFPGAYGYKP